MRQLEGLVKLIKENRGYRDSSLVRAAAALVEGPDLIPSTHKAAHRDM